MFRFNAKKGFYIYPESDSAVNPSLQMYLNEGTTFEQNVNHQEDIVITKLGLIIPQRTDLTYSEFYRAMQSNENRLIQSILNE